MGGVDNFLKTRGGIGGLFDNSQDEGMGELFKNQQLWDNLQVPTETWDNMTAQTYDPTMAKATTIQEDPMVREAQLAQLQKMAGLSNTGLSDVDAATFQQAKNDANQMARGNTQAVMANAQARGVSGGGMEFALREQGNQDAAQRAQQAELAQAAASAQQRALYNQAYGTGLQNLRGQDYTANSANTGILNQFNQANTNTANQAQQYNIGNQQDTFKYNQAGRQNTQQQNFNNQVTKIGGQTGANTGAASGYAAENAANQAARNQDMKNVTDIVKLGGAI